MAGPQAYTLNGYDGRLVRMNLVKQLVATGQEHNDMGGPGSYDHRWPNAGCMIGTISTWSW